MGHVDVFSELIRDHVPGLPETRGTMPERGFVDLLETHGVFRHHEAEVTNKNLWLSNPFAGTTHADRMWRVARALGARPRPPKPWETSFDEALVSAPMRSRVVHRVDRHAALMDDGEPSPAALEDAASDDGCGDASEMAGGWSE